MKRLSASRTALALVYLMASLALGYGDKAGAQERVKVRINAASAAELAEALPISAQLAADIVYFRNKFGYFNTIRQLLCVPGMTEEILSTITGDLTLDTDGCQVPQPGDDSDTWEEDPIMAVPKC